MFFSLRHASTSARSMGAPVASFTWSTRATECAPSSVQWNPAPSRSKGTPSSSTSSDWTRSGPSREISATASGEQSPSPARAMSAASVSGVSPGGRATMPPCA